METSARIVNILGENIEVYTDQRLPYRNVYRNNDTRSLDELFWLDGRPVVKGSQKDINLDNSTSLELFEKAEAYFLLNLGRLPYGVRFPFTGPRMQSSCKARFQVNTTEGDQDENKKDASCSSRGNINRGIFKAAGD